MYVCMYVCIVYKKETLYTHLEKKIYVQRVGVCVCVCVCLCACHANPACVYAYIDTFKN